MSAVRSRNSLRANDGPLFGLGSGLPNLHLQWCARGMSPAPRPTPVALSKRVTVLSQTLQGIRWHMHT